MNIFTLDGIAGRQRDYIHWLLGVSTGNTVESESILTADAIEILATKLRTPLQVKLHLTLALEAGNQTGEKLVTAELVEAVMSHQLDDLEPTLARHSYRLMDMLEQFDAKASEIRALFSNQLEPKRTAEIRERMLAAGLPISRPRRTARARAVAGRRRSVSRSYCWFASLE
jgi:5-carboxymethyl-2-hydroxymuconate isomerase